MNEKPRSAQIAHVLFLDIVGYSRELTTAQARLMAELNAAVSASEAFAEARAAAAVRPIPTGDGMALLFWKDVMAPARCAVDVARALRVGTLHVRMGIHSGLVQKQLDIAGNENVVGEGINTAQQVMDFGDSGHVLVSAQYAAWLQQFEDWTPLLHRIGVATTKHGLALQLFSLHGHDFGRSDPPAKLAAPTAAPHLAAAPISAARPGAGQPRTVLLYRRNVEPDESLLKSLEAELRSNGLDVFVDQHLKIGVEWAKAIEERIRAADAVVAIVSPRSLQSEMLEYELETAYDQRQKSGKPLILPVTIGPLETVEGSIGAVVGPLNQFHWRGPEDDRLLVAELLSAIREPLKPRAEEVRLEPVGGAVPPDSPFYVRRAADQEFMAALEGRESILLVKGARQIGKTSLEAQGIQRVRDLGWRCAITDYQKLSAAQVASEENFYRLLAATLARQLRFRYDFENEWLDLFGANLNMENFLRELLEAADEPLVWFMDEVDRLFTAPFASDFFGLVRSWHNSRSTEPDGPWRKLTVVIAYATEAHLFIQDLNQSPFNVGRRLDLEDFNLQQLVDLNGRYGGPLKSYEEVERLHELLGGQPFLSRRALDVLATGRFDFAGLEAQADRDDGPFGDHLKRILISISRLPAVLDYARALLDGAPGADQESYYRLLAAGVLRQERGGGIAFRCQLYQRYLAGHRQ